MARTITRVVADDDIRSRTYVELEGDSLLVHVAKHVLDEQEQWSELLGMPIPARTKKVTRAAALLTASRQLEHVLEWARETFATDAWTVFWFLLCEHEISAFMALDPARRRDALHVLKAAAASELLGGTMQLAGLPDVLVKRVVEAGRLQPYLDVLDRRTELEALLRERPAPTQIRKWIKHARTAYEARAWRHLATRSLAEARARQDLHDALGSTEQRLTAAYLAVGYRAAEAAGRRPRHCVFRRSLLPYAEAYVDDDGVAVVVGGASEKGTQQQFSIFRPLAGRGRREKARAGAQLAAFVAAGAGGERAAARAFLESFDADRGDLVEALFDRRTWTGD